MKSCILFLLLLTAGFNGAAQFSDPFEIEIVGMEQRFIFT